jgi:hypothetical protein
VTQVDRTYKPDFKVSVRYTREREKLQVETMMEVKMDTKTQKNVLIGAGLVFVIGLLFLILYLVGVFDSGGGGGGGGSCTSETFWANISTSQIEYYNGLSLRYVSHVTFTLSFSSFFPSFLS